MFVVWFINIQGSMMKMKYVEGFELERYEGRDRRTKKQERSTE